MKSIWIITILLLLVNLGNSQDIKTSISANEFVIGSEAVLSCLFPPDPGNEKLMWSNKVLPFQLICISLTSCTQSPGYFLSRNGYNITLTIKKVQKNLNKWECTNIQNTMTKFISFTIIDIKTSISANEFVIGSEAVLSCLFPPDPGNEKLMWSNKVLPFQLICISLTSCTQSPGYFLSRNGYNITLTIKKVQKNLNKWECTNIQNTMTKFISFTIIENPPLKLEITNTGPTTWEVISVCSSPHPNITCKTNTSVLTLKMTEDSKCNTSTLSSRKSTFQSDPDIRLIECHAQRGNESIDAFGKTELETSTLHATSGYTTNGKTELETSTHDATSGYTTNGVYDFNLTVENLPGCIYKIKTSCTLNPVSFKCVNGDTSMQYKEESHNCPNKLMKNYHVELQSLIYGSTFKCSIKHGDRIHLVQRTVSCHVPFYASGGVLICIGILLAGCAVTIYLFKIVSTKLPISTKLPTIWNFVMWYIGIIFVDIGVLLFLYTLSWDPSNSVFLPFLLLLIIKDIIVLLIGLYVKKNGGFFFMNTSKVTIQTQNQTSPQTSNNLSVIQ